MSARCGDYHYAFSYICMYDDSKCASNITVHWYICILLFYSCVLCLFFSFTAFTLIKCYASASTEEYSLHISNSITMRAFFIFVFNFFISLLIIEYSFRICECTVSVAQTFYACTGRRPRGFMLSDICHISSSPSSYSKLSKKRIMRSLRRKLYSHFLKRFIFSIR